MKFTFATILACSFLGLVTAGPNRLQRDVCDPAAVQSAVTTCAAANSPSAAGDCLYTALDTTLQCTKSTVDSAVDQIIGVLVGGTGQVTCDAESVAVLQQVCSSIPSALSFLILHLPPSLPFLRDES